MAEHNSLVERIDALLPQTQCRQCGFPGCLPYASAIATGDADINQCPPGGKATIQALAELLNREPKPLNPENGLEKPRLIARINEPACIGCTRCIQACPVDAILGAAKQMHTVIAQECTGCELCLAPCPVDCISMEPDPWFANPGSATRRRQKADLARQRYRFRQQRLEREQREKRTGSGNSKLPKTVDNDKDPRKAVIKAAVARVKAKRAAARKAINSVNP